VGPLFVSAAPSPEDSESDPGARSKGSLVMQHKDAYQWKRSLVAAGLSLVIVATHGHVAFSQNNAARNAAGYMILQNNRTQQELRETKQELREIKEGLGIESTSSGDSTPTPAALVLSVAFLLVCGAMTLWAIRQAINCETYRRAGDFDRYKKACGFRAMFVNLALAFGPVLAIAFMARDRADAIPQEGFAVGFFAWIAWCVLLKLLGRTYVSETRLRKLFEELHPAASGVQSTASRGHPSTLRNPHQSFVRLPSGEIKGPGEKANIRVLAKQGGYPPGTQWSDTANGPWETLVEEAAITPSLRLWIRTPDGRSGGPYTRDQIKKAIATGKLAANAQAASTPSGPWRSIGSFSG
jgi:hypothetical protein